MTDAATTTNATVAAELKQRIEQLELGQQYSVNQKEVQKIQAQHLLQLREIRKEMASTGGGSTEELLQLQIENEELKKRNTKLEYRVQHVVGNLERLLDASSAE